jgi:hypothetical protein
MRELLIVITDFYVPPEGATSPTTKERLPGLSNVARYGIASNVPNGWRAWLAEWLGRGDLTQVAPASIAAAVLDGAPVQESGTQWIAEPVHLITGLRSVHFDYEGLLSIDASTQVQLMRSFEQDFASAPYALAALPSGRFMIVGPPAPALSTVDPVRYLGSSIEGTAPSGEGAAGLRRLAGEIEMWLHEHPINIARMRNRQRAISTLWLWGGGAPLGAQARTRTPSAKQTLFGNDPFIDGIARLTGARRATAQQWADVIQIAANDDQAVIALEAFRLPQSSSISTPLQALEAIDRDWIAPAFEATASGEVQRLTLLANDQSLTVTPRDRLKFWRRPRGAFLTGR